MHKVAKNLTRYTVYVIMFIHVIRVFVLFISLLFLDLLLLLRHLLPNILVFSTQPHKHCNIFYSHHVSKDHISRTQFISYSFRTKICNFRSPLVPWSLLWSQRFLFLLSQTKLNYKAALSVLTVRPNM